jgi:hypothetical protein
MYFLITFLSFFLSNIYLLNVDPRRVLFSQAALLYQLVFFLSEVEHKTELTLTQVMTLGMVGQMNWHIFPS